MVGDFFDCDKLAEFTGRDSHWFGINTHMEWQKNAHVLGEFDWLFGSFLRWRFEFNPLLRLAHELNTDLISIDWISQNG